MIASGSSTKSRENLATNVVSQDESQPIDTSQPIGTIPVTMGMMLVAMGRVCSKQ